MEWLHELSPEFCAKGKELLATSVWTTEQIIFEPAENVVLHQVDRDLIEPDDAKK